MNVNHVSENTKDQQNAIIPQGITEEELEALLEEVHSAQSSGDFEKARKLLEEKIRQRGWKKAKLWWELVALMKSPEDYSQIRNLWFDTPRSCRKRLSILRAVARAACVAGEHEEGRDILRMAIIFAAQKKQKGMLSGKREQFKNLVQWKKIRQEKEESAFDNRAPQALKDLNYTLDSFGVKAFLISGTLLGFTRDGAFISWDKDIDVGVFSEEVPENLETLFRDQENFNVRRIDFNSNRLRVTHKNKIAIDIFPHYMEKGIRWHDGTATRWWNTPFDLKKADFLGVDVWIPENPELYLVENYGDDWKIPDPYFDARIDAPNTEITDQKYFDSLQYFSLLKSITDEKAHMKERYINILKELGEDKWLDRL